MPEIKPDVFGVHGAAKPQLFFDRFWACSLRPQTNLGVVRITVNVPNCSASKIWLTI